MKNTTEIYTKEYIFDFLNNGGIIQDWFISKNPPNQEYPLFSYKIINNKIYTKSSIDDIWKEDKIYFVVNSFVDFIFNTQHLKGCFVQQRYKFITKSLSALDDYVDTLYI
jgi:hypothetical protein